MLIRIAIIIKKIKFIESLLKLLDTIPAKITIIVNATLIPAKQPKQLLDCSTTAP